MFLTKGDKYGWVCTVQCVHGEQWNRMVLFNRNENCVDACRFIFLPFNRAHLFTYLLSLSLFPPAQHQNPTFMYFFYCIKTFLFFVVCVNLSRGFSQYSRWNAKMESTWETGHYRGSERVNVRRVQRQLHDWSAQENKDEKKGKKKQQQHQKVNNNRK